MEKLQISLVAARVNARLTQERVTKILKVSKQSLSNWETGQSEPKISQVQELSKLYQIPIDNIFCPTNQIKIDLSSKRNDSIGGEIKTENE